MFRARVWNDDASTDLFVALLQLREDLIRPATEFDRQRPVDIHRPPPLAGDVALAALGLDGERGGAAGA